MIILDKDNPGFLKRHMSRSSYIMNQGYPEILLLSVHSSHYSVNTRHPIYVGSVAL